MSPARAEPSSSFPFPRRVCEDLQSPPKRKRPRRPAAEPIFTLFPIHEDSDMNRIPAPSLRSAIVTLALSLGWAGAIAQQAPDSAQRLPSPAQDSDFNRHLDDLTRKLDSMRQQLIDSQNEMDELRNEIGRAHV